MSRRASQKCGPPSQNSLFYRTASVAKMGDIYRSLIQTCQRNDVNPWNYLTEFQRNH